MKVRVIFVDGRPDDLTDSAEQDEIQVRYEGGFIILSWTEPPAPHGAGRCQQAWPAASVVEVYITDMFNQTGLYGGERDSVVRVKGA